MRIRSTVVSGSRAAIGDRSTFTIACARRAVGPLRAGVEAWPPRPSTRSSTLVVPFSATPMAATGRFTPGNASYATAPPSSSTSHGRTLRRTSSSTAAGAVGPETSSSQPKDSQTSCAGRWPSSSSSSTASQIAATQPLSSRVPRPQTAPSTMSAEKGGCCQGADSSTGTTSRCAIRTTGFLLLAPGQWNSRPWLPTRVSSSRSCSSGNCVRSSASNRSKASVSTRDQSRSETVGMRTSACSFATARSVMAAR